MSNPPIHPECQGCRCAEAQNAVRVIFDASVLSLLSDEDHARVSELATRLLTDKAWGPHLPAGDERA